MIHRTATAKQHEAVKLAFLEFLSDEFGRKAELAWATPSDVVAFLASKDAGGTLVVHNSVCPQWGQRTTKKARSCECPVRAAASTINTQQGWVQAVFRDAGFTKPYCVSSATGNPANSALVHAHVDMCLRERAVAGMKPLQADVISAPVLVWVLKHLDIAHANAERRKDWNLSASRSRLKLFVLACWATGLRAADVVRVLHQQISMQRNDESGKAELSLLVTVTKSRHDPGGYRHISLEATGPLSCGRALIQYTEDLKRLGLHLGSGPLFRRYSVAGSFATWMDKAVSRDAFALQFDIIVKACGIAGVVTLHSIHGSSSVFDKERGVLPAQTMRRIGWTYSTYAYYTLGRRVLRLSDVTVKG